MMSSRNFRKVCGHTLPPVDSDGEYDPHARCYNTKSTYEGLHVSSDSDSERELEKINVEDNQENATSSSESHSGAPNNKGKYKATGKKGRSKLGRRLIKFRYNPRVHEENLDEIDMCILKVNALLGEPPTMQVKEEESKVDEVKIEENNDVPINVVLKVKPRHLYVTNELNELFGPEDPAEVSERNISQPHRLELLKRVMVVPTNDTLVYDYKKKGIFMKMENRVGNIKHFVYAHNVEYQNMNDAFIYMYANNPNAVLAIDEAKENMHVELLLQSADAYFDCGEYSIANEVIENVVAYLQFVAHPLFKLSSPCVRLSYSFLENRPFHVAMLKYAYLLSNKACHRTALEIAKMLLNMDPDDPLAVLFIIDTLALRAEEYEWFIYAMEYFYDLYPARCGMLFNLEYSLALAYFHVAIISKKSLAMADQTLQSAMKYYPRMVLNVLDCAKINEPDIQTHDVFTNDLLARFDRGLSELMLIYAKLTWPLWREPNVMKWFIENAKVFIKQYHYSPNASQPSDRFDILTPLRTELLNDYSIEVMRHISVIKPMTMLLIDTELHPLCRPTSSWNPLFCDGINRYSYRTPQYAEYSPPKYIIMSPKIFFRQVMRSIGGRSHRSNRQ